jgi:hypothetical protein
MPPVAARHFFGYGSLVNRATHAYPGAQPAHLQGWRRVWVQTSQRELAFLSVRPDPDCTIAGLVAHVPAGDWAALDLREYAYARHPVPALVAGASLPVQVYAVPQDRSDAVQATHPILLSYLDTVVQGFLREFGPEGADGFFATTEGWAAPILNDRDAPRYPRAQTLSRADRATVDTALQAIGAQIV